MQNKTEKTKKSPRFGILDAVIILLIVAVIAGVYFRYQLMDWITAQRNLREYNVTFAIDNIRYTTPNYINVGDEIYFANGDTFGTLIEESDGASNIKLSITPASESFTENGEVFTLFYPNDESRVDVRGRIRCTGTFSADKGFLVNGSTYVAAGQVIRSQTELVTVDLRILSIEVAE